MLKKAAGNLLAVIKRSRYLCIYGVSCVYFVLKSNGTVGKRKSSLCWELLVQTYTKETPLYEKEI
jgi:hypothetical protein